MENEYYGIATTHTDDYLAHYGVKGMKWGVRRALDQHNDRALGRQYRKAQKKLAKLEKQAANGKKYAKRAAALGVGAAAAGGLAAAGTGGVSKGLHAIGAYGSRAMKGLGTGIEKAGTGIHKGLTASGHAALGNKIHKSMNVVGRGLNSAGSHMGVGVAKAAEGVSKWGHGTSISDAAEKTIRSASFNGSRIPGARNLSKKVHGITNNTIARAGAAAIGAGLAGAAGYNAYRAATTKKAARKAAEFRREMNKAFAGTKYGRSNGGNRQGKKHRR